MEGTGFVAMVIVAMVIVGCEDSNQQAATAQQQRITQFEDCRYALPPISQDNLENNQRKRANLSLKLSEFQMVETDIGYKYNHRRSFIENRGVGGYIYRGRICPGDNDDGCADSCVVYRFDANTILDRPNQNFITKNIKDVVRVRYWYRDDYGNLGQINILVNTDHGRAFSTNR